ncbi:MAG TPA: TatD family hydrolase [Steroidobacteraceae bacterium]|jgi:TatD DNase family protein|nr:TatD family hydrolase [Steroidobacteraceae bacterium]
MTNLTTGRAAPAAATVAGVTLIDIGINLAHKSFSADRDAVIARAYAAGVEQMVVTGSDAVSSREAVRLARAHPQRLFATAGVHPHHAAQWSAALAADLQELASCPEVVAIGECGLDYYRNLAAPAAQRAAFQRQLELAASIGKPVFLHQRDAHADFVAILREHRALLSGAVAHCFTGTAAELECYLEMRLLIGITGWICDERRGAHLLPLMRAIPAQQLLLESDAPYLIPRDLAPKPVSRRNEPAYLPHIAAAVARARAEPLARLAQDTTANAQRLFRLPLIH